MTLEPSALRMCPQLAALELLAQAAETAVVTLCAAHPALEQPLSTHDLAAIERLADEIVERALETVDALNRYRLLLRDLERLDHESFSADESLF